MQNTLQAYDTRTPRAIPWDSVVVRRTINRKTGVVMAEDYTEELTENTINSTLQRTLSKGGVNCVLLLGSGKNGSHDQLHRM